MNDETFDRAIHQCRDLGVKVLDFTPLVGDPLLDPKIVDRLEKAKREREEKLRKKKEALQARAKAEAEKAAEPATRETSE